MGTEPGGLQNKDGLGLDQAIEAGGLRGLDGLFPEPSNGGGNGGALYDPGQWNSMVHYWTFNGDATDAVGSEDLSLFDGQFSSSQVVDGQSLEGVTPASQDIAAGIAGASTSILPQPPFTIAGWIYGNDDGNMTRLLSILNDSGVTFLELTLDASLNFNSTIRDSASSFTVNGNQAQAGQFNHLALTYDGSTMESFLNGASQGTQSPSGDVGYSGTLNFAFMQFINDGDFIDEVTEFDSVMSASEIDELYQAGHNTLRQ